LERLNQPLSSPSFTSNVAGSETMADPNKTKVTILTGAYRIKGYIELMPGARVTDYMVEAKDFIAVTEAEVWELGDRKVMTAPFLNVSRHHIQIITPWH
jgi:hypothetical protein